MFDPETFLTTAEVDVAGSTTYVLIPEGEYPMVMTKIEPKKLGEKEIPVLDLTWEVIDGDGKLMQLTGRDKNLSHQTVFLDITESGYLDMGQGRNVQLNRVREAVRQNVPGQKWNPTNMLGIIVTGEVEQYQDKNGETRNRVRSVRAQ